MMFCEDYAASQLYVGILMGIGRQLKSVETVER